MDFKFIIIIILLLHTCIFFFFYLVCIFLLYSALIWVSGVCVIYIIDNFILLFQVRAQYGSVGGCVSSTFSGCGRDLGPSAATVSEQCHV